MPRKMGVPISQTHPQLARQANGWDPSSYSAGSHAMVSWRCGKGHIWDARLSSRAGKDSNGCPFCSGKSVIPGENDLATLFPAIAKEAFGWNPAEVLPRSAKKRLWMCLQGHIWEASIANRTGINKTGCAVCANRKLLEGFNDLSSLYPQIAKEADGWDPKLVLSGSGTKKNWKCSLGHKFTTTVDSRTGKKQSGCPVCSGQKLLVGFNDLGTTHPEIALQANGWNPTEYSPGSSSKKSWFCSKGHIWEAIIANRTKTGAGCHFCSNLRLLTGFNDLATTHPEIASQADGWDPRTKIAGSHQEVTWKCADGHRWKTKLGSRTGSDLTGCPTCATSGYDPNKDGWLYFLSHSDWEMLQIGITNVPDDRLTTHKRLGWELLELRGPMNGDLARQWESDILKMLKAKKVGLGSSKNVGKFTGYTESWNLNSYPAKSLKELMEAVKEFEK